MSKQSINTKRVDKIINKDFLMNLIIFKIKNINILDYLVMILN